VGVRASQPVTAAGLVKGPQQNDFPWWQRGYNRDCTNEAADDRRFRDAHASPTAPSVFAAPGPVVVMATPSRPVARA